MAILISMMFVPGDHTFWNIYTSVLNSWLIAHFLTYYKIVLNLKSCDNAPESLILKILSLYFCKNNTDIFYIPYLQERS